MGKIPAGEGNIRKAVGSLELNIKIHFLLWKKDNVMLPKFFHKKSSGDQAKFNLFKIEFFEQSNLP